MDVVIIEDEEHNSRMLEGMVKTLRPDWNILTILESVKDSVEWFNQNEHPELIFMDIQLTDGISFSIFDKVEIKSLVIFTTAYNEFAVKAFKVNSVDYLLKPIKEDDLETAIIKFEEFSKKSQAPVLPEYQDLINAIKSGENKYRNRFLISGASSFFKIETKDISYFYTENRVMYAVMNDGKQHVIDLTMEKLEEQLDPYEFFRANRSYILKIDSVRKFENYFGGKLIVRLVPPHEEPITISRLKATAFRQWLDGVV